MHDDMNDFDLDLNELVNVVVMKYKWYNIDVVLGGRE